MSLSQYLRRATASYPSYLPRDTFSVRTLDHLVATNPSMEIIDGTVKASKSEEVGRREKKRTSTKTSLVDTSVFHPSDFVESGPKDHPLDVAITPLEFVKMANDWNADVEIWTLTQLDQVTPLKGVVRHPNFDDIDCLVRFQDSHRTLGRSAGFFGVLNAYYETRAILMSMGLWDNKYVASYRPGAILKTHKILGWSEDSQRIGYESLFDGSAITDPGKKSVAGTLYRELTARVPLADTGFPEPILAGAHSERLYEQSGGMLFDMQKMYGRMAIALGSDIDVYVYETKEEEDTER